MTQKEIIDRLESDLKDLKSVVKYEALKPIEQMEKDIKHLKKATADHDVVKDRLNLIYKSMIWIATVVFGAVLLAIVNLVLRNPQ